MNDGLNSGIKSMRVWYDATFCECDSENNFYFSYAPESGNVTFTMEKPFVFAFPDETELLLDSEYLGEIIPTWTDDKYTQL